ncbi:MAG: hypothetical protein GY711_17040 [bacterium]|nr:hypothetical protein [bacterium]
MPPEREPTRDELLAMAFADGELRGEELDRFQARLASEPGLVREVSEYLALQLIARQMAPREPADYEWDRLREDIAHQAGERLSWLLFTGAVLGLIVTGVIGIANSELETLPKTFALGAILGLGLLLLMTLRARLRVLPYDPYRKVER